MKLLFINPHPDDTEFMAASTCQQAVDLGWEVTEILMTCDEYGTKRDDFKGARIQKIRRHEMIEAAKRYGVKADGTPKIKLIWFGEFDGYLRFNAEIFTKLRNLVEKLKPNVVIAPDSYFSMDLHPDHARTGWLAYHICKNIPIGKKPELWLYHSFNPNFYVPIKNINIQVDAWEKHRSQTTPLFNKGLRKLRMLFYFLRKRKTGNYMCEGFRKVIYKANENEIKSLKHRIIYALFAPRTHLITGKRDKRYLPSPKDLGLVYGPITEF